VTFGVWCALVLATATAAAQFVDYGVFDLRLRALDSNTHASIFGVVSLVANLAAVLVATLLAGRTRTLEHILLACILGVLFVLRVTAPGDVVLVLSLPLTGSGLAILWRQARPAAGSQAQAIRAGCVLLVVSFVVHAIEQNALSPLSPSPDSWAYQIRCVLKHDAELAGWILITVGLACAWVAAGLRPSARQSASRT
jgi:hypothetical protein